MVEDVPQRAEGVGLSSVNQAERKTWIVQRIREGDFENIHEAWAVVGGEYNSLEALPFGLKTRPNHIFSDFMDNKLTGPASVQALLDAVLEVPDTP
ncbi:hypothetical protein ACS5PN_01820 [Roseateles sp. NT4]|uniref:hypothetical protein n=1 Tax=Roseateles sp. NT4 TaxID=3453715 RepID=UPI003EE97172